MSSNDTATFMMPVQPRYKIQESLLLKYVNK